MASKGSGVRLPVAPPINVYAPAEVGRMAIAAAFEERRRGAPVAADAFNRMRMENAQMIAVALDEEIKTMNSGS